MARAKQQTVEVEEIKEVYEVPVFCRNCRWASTVEVEKGLIVMEIECPNCGCFTLRTDWRGWPGVIEDE